MSYTAPPNGFRTFLVLWASQSVSVFGSAMTMFAVNIWLVKTVYPAPAQQPQLAWALAAMSLAIMIPVLLAMPLGGALADRMDRKRLMLLSDGINGLLMSLLFTLMWTGHLQMYTLLAILAAQSVATGVHSSTFDTAYAMLVSDAQLPRANGMMQTMYSLSSLLSPAIAAILIAVAGPFLAIVVDSLTFFLAAGVLAVLQIPSPKRNRPEAAGGKPNTIWSDIMFGLTYIWQRRPLFWLVASYAVMNLFGSIGVYLPLVVKLNLAPDWAARGYKYETALALLNTVFALGGIAGGALVSFWGGAKRRRVVVLMLSIAVGGIGQVLMGWSPVLYAAAAAGFVLMFSVPFGNAHSQAIWQSQVPREFQGRVFAVRRVIAMGLNPAGSMLAGWLAGIMNPGRGLMLGGSVLAAVALLQLFNPQVRRLDDDSYVHEVAG